MNQNKQIKRENKEDVGVNMPMVHFFCYFCRKSFDLDENASAGNLKKVLLGEEVVGVCCPKCEYEKMANAPSMPEKYPQGYVMKGDDGELRILHNKTWCLVREGDVVSFEIVDVDGDLDLETLKWAIRLVNEAPPLSGGQEVKDWLREAMTKTYKSITGIDIPRKS